MFRSRRDLARWEIVYERGGTVPAWAARAIASGFSPRAQALSIRAQNRARYRRARTKAFGQ